MRFAAKNGSTFVGAAVLSLVSAIFAMGQSVETSNQKWALTAINGKPVVSTKAYIEIDKEKGRFTGSTGCNRMFGGIAANERLKFGAVGMTRMACLEGDVSKVESEFMAALAKVTEIREGGATLEMLDGSSVLLSFKSSTTSSEIKLADKKWILESIKGNGIKLTSELPFVNFDTKEMRLSGNTGCNVFGGGFTITGNKFDASQMMSTLRACEEEDRMTIERRVLDGVEKADSFEIKGGKLTFFEGRELLLTFRGEAK